MWTWLSIFIGGGIGSLCRYGIGRLISTEGFPLGTLTANVLACLILGFLMGLEARKGFSNNYSLLLMTGFCGGFSTFSTFSAESLKLLEQSHYGTALSYILSSLLICIVGIALGYFLSKLF